MTFIAFSRLFLTSTAALFFTQSHALQPRYVLFDGSINKETVSKAIEATKKIKGIKTFYISSSGGDSYEGMRLGRYLNSKQIHVAVVGECFSACANYVFLPSKHRSAAPWARIGLHGGFRSFYQHALEHADKAPPNAQEILNAFISAIQKSAKEESQLLKAAGVKPEIIEKSAQETLLGAITLKTKDENGLPSSFIIAEKKFTDYPLWFPSPENHQAWGIDIKTMDPSSLPIELFEKFSSFETKSLISNAP